jgi:hypothetical protein
MKKKPTIFKRKLSPAQHDVLATLLHYGEWELRTSFARCFLISTIDRAKTKPVARSTWRVLSDEGYIVEDKSKEFFNRLNSDIIHTWVLTAKGRMAV